MSKIFLLLSLNKLLGIAQVMSKSFLSTSNPKMIIELALISIGHDVSVLKPTNSLNWRALSLFRVVRSKI